MKVKFILDRGLRSLSAFQPSYLRKKSELIDEIAELQPSVNEILDALNFYISFFQSRNISHVNIVGLLYLEN